MSVFAPTIDFTQILDEMGQSIILRKITRTLDTNGNVTSVISTDSNITALVQEVSYKEKQYIEMGIVNLGDTMFFVSPSVMPTIYDRVLWNATTFNIRKVLIPPRINGIILFKQLLCVQDAGDFPT